MSRGTTALNRFDMNEFPGRTIHGQSFTIVVVRHRLFTSLYNVNLVVRPTKTTCPRTLKLNRTRLSYMEARKLAIACAEHISSPLASVNYRQGLPSSAEIILSRNDVTLLRCPAEVLKNPDNFLAPGDEIFVQCKSLNVRFFHSGVYAGNERVYHFMGDPIDQVTSLSEVILSGGTIHFDSWTDYVYSNLTYEASDNFIPTIYKVQYPLRVRSGDTIVSEAYRLFHSGVKFVYDLRRNNCQHFSSYCSTGRPFSYDMTQGLKSMACSILELGCSIRKCDVTKFFGHYSDDESSNSDSLPEVCSSGSTLSSTESTSICIRF